MARWVSLDWFAGLIHHYLLATSICSLWRSRSPVRIGNIQHGLGESWKHGRDALATSNCTFRTEVIFRYGPLHQRRVRSYALFWPRRRSFFAVVGGLPFGF